MRIKIQLIGLMLSVGLLLYVFSTWFFSPFSSGLDLNWYYASTFEDYHLFPYAWNFIWNDGMGGNALSFQWIQYSYTVPILLFGRILHLPWPVIQKIAFFYPILFLGYSSSYMLARQIINRKYFIYFSPTIFILNTYVLLLTGGGQVQIALAYTLIPLILYFAIMASRLEVINLNKITLHQVGIILLFIVQMFLDIRIAYITFCVYMLYLAYKIVCIRSLKYIKYVLVTNLFIGLAIIAVHSFWILPLISLHQNIGSQLGNAYVSVEMVRFLSFAKLENTLSLLHPNWPENIFGKVYFMRPEFLILPMLAFGALFFVQKLPDKQRGLHIYFFSLLALLGAFLAKGTNEPFASIYPWMFNHVPGFIMFRDASKWYVLVGVSYAVLIPFTLSEVYEWFRVKKWNHIQYLFLIGIICYLLFLIRPALLGQLGGTFRTTYVPKEYVQLEHLLYSQKTFSRTLWVPTQQRFTYYSNNHPAVPAQNFFSTTNAPDLYARIATSETLLRESAVKYMIVPYDSEGDIFLKDRKYDDALSQEAVASISALPFVSPVGNFGKIKVFELNNTKDHFWSTDAQMKISYIFNSPVSYAVTVSRANKGDVLIFSESFDSGWEMIIGTKHVTSHPYEKYFNSFILPQDGTYHMQIYYTPQKYVNIGLVISGISLCVILGSLIYFAIRRKQ